jgi:hypothetical protein
MTYLSDQNKNKSKKHKISGECFPLINVSPHVFEMVSEPIWDDNIIVTFQSAMFYVFMDEGEAYR